MARETLFSLQRGTFGRSKEKRVILTVREVNCFGLHLSAGKSAGRLAFLLADYGDAEALWMQLPFLKRKLQPRGLIGWRKIHAMRLKFRTNDQTVVGSKSRTAPEPVTSSCLLDKSVINQMQKKNPPRSKSASAIYLRNTLCIFASVYLLHHHVERTMQRRFSLSVRLSCLHICPRCSNLPELQLLS